MAKLLEDHKCESCNNQTYHVRLAEPQPVKVAAEGGTKPEFSVADYAIIHMNKVTFPSGKVFEDVEVWAADAEENAYPGMIYSYNRGRSLDEVLFIIGGEWNANRPDSKVDNGTP